MSRIQTKTIALFPGAFQPPHGAHLAAVRFLAGRPDVDEVVIVITNRNRGIPGTTLSLEARLSQQIWQIYLEGLEGVRTEIAPHTAVAHALYYLTHTDPGDRLVYCIGEQDLADGDARFEDLPRQGRERGVEVEVVAAPTAGIKVRATGLRRCIARGEPGREEFIAGLPEALSAEQRERVWRLCRDGVREVCDLAAERLVARLDEAAIGEVADIACVDRSRIDPVFRLRMADGRQLLARYAGDAEGDDGGHDMARKPRRALKVERRALAALRACPGHLLEIADEVLFERRKGVLVIDEVLPACRSLAGELAAGRSVASALSRVGWFLAACRQLQPGHLRNSDDEDRAHGGERCRQLGAASTMRPEFSTLLDASAAAGGPGLIWMHAVAAAVRVDGERVGVVDFEHASGWGDPALDPGTLSGDCIATGLIAGHADLALAGVEALWAAWAGGSTRQDPGLPGRAAGWAAAAVGRRFAAAERDLPPAIEGLWALAGGGRQAPATTADLLSALRAFVA